MANLLQSGVASAERVFDLLDAPEQVPGPGRAATLCRPPAGAVEFEHVSFRYEPDVAADRGPVAGRRARPVGRDRRADRRRQDHAGQPGHAVLRARRRPDHPRRRRHRQRCAATTCAARSGWCCRTRGCSTAPSGTTSRTAARARPRRRSSRRPRATYVDRFVHSLPDGYDTVIDDEGSNISAGERQLVTIARAFLAAAVAADPRRGDAARSTPAPRCWCRRRWRRCARTAPASSSPTGSRRSATPT